MYYHNIKMRIIITGVAIGFFAAVFLSMYAENLFNYKLPYFIIYGIIGPFLAAVAILVLTLARKGEEKRNGIDWWEEEHTRQQREM